MGFTFVVLNITGTLVKKGYSLLLRRFLYIYFLISFIVILITLIFFEVFATNISALLSNQPDLLGYTLTFIILLIPCIIPYHLETSLQSIISGHKKQKLISLLNNYCSCNLGLIYRYIFIFVCNLAIYGAFFTTFVMGLS
jgi:Na+-driven multidrug efflux pump